jgi:1,2-diacylglycerol 3-beta-galactosyltransferase
MTFQARSKALGRPEAVYQIMEDLAKLAHNPDYNFGPAKAAISSGLVKS